MFPVRGTLRESLSLSSPIPLEKGALAHGCERLDTCYPSCICVIAGPGRRRQLVSREVISVDRSEVADPRGAALSPG